MDGDKFRKYYCYNVGTDTLLKKNEVPIRKLYDSFLNIKKKYLTMDEMKQFVRKCDLNISELFTGAIYAECMMTIVDTIRDPSKTN